MLASNGAPRPRRIGLPVPERTGDLPEHRLYQLVAQTDPESAHSRYDAWIGRLVSFENAAECAQSADAIVTRPCPVKRRPASSSASRVSTAAARPHT